MEHIAYRFKITSESTSYHPLFDEKIYLYSGDSLDFTYSNQHRGSGFSGTLTFIETT